MWSRVERSSRKPAFLAVGLHGHGDFALRAMFTASIVSKAGVDESPMADLLTLPLRGIHDIDAPYAHSVREQVEKAKLHTHQPGTNPRHPVLTRKHVGRNHCQLKQLDNGHYNHRPH